MKRSNRTEVEDALLRIRKLGFRLRDEQKGAKKTSKYIGVCKASRGCKRRWRAQIYYAHVKTHLGTFDTEEKAARAYNQAARIAWGKRAKLNDV